MLATISSKCTDRWLKRTIELGVTFEEIPRKIHRPEEKEEEEETTVADKVGDKTKFELGNTRYWRRGINWWKFCEAKFAREIDIVLDERSTVEFRSVEMHRSGNNN